MAFVRLFSHHNRNVTKAGLSGLQLNMLLRLPSNSEQFSWLSLLRAGILGMNHLHNSSLFVCFGFGVNRNLFLTLVMALGILYGIFSRNPLFICWWWFVCTLYNVQSLIHCRLASNSLCSWGWFWTPDLPISTSQVQGSQVWASRPTSSGSSHSVQIENPASMEDP